MFDDYSVIEKDGDDFDSIPKPLYECPYCGLLLSEGNRCDCSNNKPKGAGR